MADTLRNVGSILVGYAGFALGGPLGAAVATVLFNVIVPAKSLGGDLGKGGDGTANTEIGQGIYQVFGRGMREGGDFLRCPLDNEGLRSGIAIRTTTSGGGSGKVGGPKVTTEKQFLRASFGICEGYTVIDKFIEVSTKLGEVVKFDRFGGIAGEVEVTPVYGAVTGQLVADLSETVRFYYGSEEQPVDSAEAAWYGGDVSADRGLVKVVFNDYGPLEAGTTFRFWLRNTLTGRRSIMEARLTRAGIPSSRIDLVSIPANLNDYGWYVEGPEPARDLAEQVAATSYHDLHFMATARGMVFTDISRVNPRFIYISSDEQGAFENNGGGGSPVSLTTEHIQTSENKPRVLKINCKNKDRNFKDDGVRIVWTQARGGEQTVSLRKIAGMAEIYDFAEIVMRELQNAEGLVDVPLLPGRCEVAPGCVLILPDPSDANPSRVRFLRVVSQRITPNSVLLCSCAPYDASVYNSVLSPPVVVEPPPAVKNYGIPRAIWMGGQSLASTMVASPTMLLATRINNGEAWGNAAVTVEGNTDGANLLAPAAAGLLKTAYTYTDEDLYAFDYDTTLQIQLDDGESLTSTSEDLVINSRANVLWLNGTYLGYTTANAISPTLYEITGLYPGMAGSDNVRVFNINSRVVRLTDEDGNQLVSVVGVPFDDVNVNRALPYHSVSLGNARKIENGSVTCTANNMRVLAPSPHVVVGSTLAGGILVKAFARSRYPDASLAYWDSKQKFKHSDPFTYTLEILSNTSSSIRYTKKLTFSSGELEWILTPTEKTAVFGSVMPATVRGRIYGENDYGAGFIRSFLVNYNG